MWLMRFILIKRKRWISQISLSWVKAFCIKQACSQSYATDAQAIAILCQLCDEKGIPYQRFVNRSDSRGGSTLGSIAGTLLPVKTVDIGIPILAMHSACELMGVRDMKLPLSDCVTAFFTGTIKGQITIMGK